MKGFLLVLLFCPAILLAQSFLKLEDSDSADSQDECRSCNVENCFPLGDCVAGVVKDACGCCDVCAKSEFEMCDHPDTPYYKAGFRGRCGTDLECKLRSDALKDEPLEAICYCKEPESVCGSDHKTYDNVCQLKTAVLFSGNDVTVKKQGPCHSDPVIVTHPQNVKNTTGSSIALLCEARGFPTPIIEWTWTRVDGKVFTLPSDDLHISINMRGGPEKWQITGWLQIIDLMKVHEGDYTCIAQNEEAFAKSSARVKVIQEKEAL